MYSDVFHGIRLEYVGIRLEYKGYARIQKAHSTLMTLCRIRIQPQNTYAEYTRIRTQAVLSTRKLVRVRGDVCSVVHARPLHASAQHSAPLHASAQHGAAASRGYTLLLYFIVSCMYSDVF